jgi:hypothetical protein
LRRFSFLKGVIWLDFRIRVKFRVRFSFRVRVSFRVSVMVADEYHNAGTTYPYTTLGP